MTEQTVAVDEQSWTHPMRWLVTMAAVLVVGIGSQISTPGFDVQILQELGFPATLPIVGGVMWLVVIRALRQLGGSDSIGANRAAFVAYLILVFGTAWSPCLAAEQVGYGREYLVPEPGVWFRLLASTTHTAGAAVLWMLADLVSRRGVGSGPMVLFGMSSLWAAFRGTFSAGYVYGLTGELPTSALSSALGTMLVLGAVAWRAPSWPASVGPFTARSPLDLVFAPAFVGFGLASVLAYGPQGPISELVVVLAAPVTALLVARALPESGNERNPVPILAALLVGAATAISLLLGFARSGGLQRVVQPGPFHGPGNFVVELTSPDGSPADAELIGTRLDGLRVDHRIVPVETGLRVELSSVERVPDLMNLVLPRYELGLHEVLQGTAVQSLTVQDCSYGQCVPMLVAPATIDNGDVADSGVTISEYTGEPMVLIEFTPQGAKDFGDLTTRVVGRRIAIVIDGRVLSAPNVMEPITAGRAQISMGLAANPQAEAEALAVSLRHQPLTGSWSVASVSAR